MHINSTNNLNRLSNHQVTPCYRYNLFSNITPYYSCFLHSAAGRICPLHYQAEASKSVEEEASGSCTTELVETEIGLPSNCSMILPSISVKIFLNSSSLTNFPSSASSILKASLTILSICKD